MVKSKSFLKCCRFLLLVPVLLLCGTAEVSSLNIAPISITPSYTLTVTKSGYGKGNSFSDVLVNPGALSWNGSSGTDSYLRGTTVTLTAKANPTGPYVSWFLGWYGGGCTGPGTCLATDSAGRCTQSTCTVTMNADKNVTAYFDRPKTITFPSWISGTIAPPFGGAVITTSENYATSLPNGNFLMIHDPGTWTLTATADGCSSYSTSVTVVEMQTTNVPITMTCSWTSTIISPTSNSFTSSGGTGSVAVTMPGDYAWTASSNAGWITITGGSTGTGNGTVSYSVAANASGSPRTGTLTIVGQLFTVTQANADTTAPTVTITSPTSGTTHSTSTTPLAIGGTASDTGGVTSVTWANSLGGSGSCTGTTSWSCSIALSSGTNNITITAKDAANNSGTDTLAVTYTPPDVTPPVTTASPAGGTFGSTQNVTLSANETATIYYTTNGTNPTESSSVYSAPIPVAITTTLKFFAKDAAGNVESVIKSQTYVIYPNGIPGDLNNDGAVTFADAIIALKVMMGASSPDLRSNYKTSTADVNGDGKVGMAEVLYIIQKAAGAR